MTIAIERQGLLDIPRAHGRRVPGTHQGVRVAFMFTPE